MKQSDYKNFIKKTFSTVLVAVFFATSSSVCSAKGFSIFLKKDKKKDKQQQQTVIPQPKTLNGEAVYSIEDCIDIALKNDPNIKIGQTQKDIANSDVGLAKSEYFPNITASTGFTSQHNKNTGKGGGF